MNTQSMAEELIDLLAAGGAKIDLKTWNTLMIYAPKARIAFEDLQGDAREVMFQMFVFGPIWDGYLASKNGRDTLVDAGLAQRGGQGWQWLTRAGVEMATTANVRDWTDDRWHKKQQK